MQAPDFPPDEKSRMASQHALDVLDALPEERFFDNPLLLVEAAMYADKNVRPACRDEARDVPGCHFSR